MNLKNYGIRVFLNWTIFIFLIIFHFEISKYSYYECGYNVEQANCKFICDCGTENYIESRIYSVNGTLCPKCDIEGYRETCSQFNEIYEKKCFVLSDGEMCNVVINAKCINNLCHLTEYCATPFILLFCLLFFIDISVLAISIYYSVKMMCNETGLLNDETGLLNDETELLNNNEKISYNDVYAPIEAYPIPHQNPEFR